MSKKITKEEKEKIIADYKTSGLSMTKWCNANGIAPSTLSGWINGKNTNSSTSKNKAKFEEVILPTELPADNNANIIVEYKSFKITVPANIELVSLENTLRAVVQINV